MHIPPPNRVFFWLSVTILLRLVATFILFWLGEYTLSDGLIGNLATDSQDYLQTAYQLAIHGSYSRVTGVPYAGRTPGYDVVLAPLLWLLDEKTALNITFLLQWLFATLSCYCLAVVAYRIFNSKKIFAATLIIYSLNTFVAYYDWIILTESFAVSAQILGLYLLTGKRSTGELILSGGLFTWAVFLRPYLLPLYFLLGLLLLWHYRKLWQQALIKGAAFASVFVIVEVAWVARNYLHFGRVIPLATDKYGGLTEGRLLALIELIQAWGGDYVWWNHQAEITLFIDMTGILSERKYYKTASDLPSFVFTSKYNADSIDNLRAWYIMADTTKNDTLRAYSDSIAHVKLRSYRQAFIAEKPFYYYVIAPLRLLAKFFSHSGTYNLTPQVFSELPLSKQLVRVAYGILYHWIWIAGLIGLIIYSLHRYKSISSYNFALITMSLYAVILFPLLLRRIEYRHFVMSYPFLQIYAIVVLGYIYRQFLTKKANFLS
ncbi:MAG: hypothetical protein RML94_15690 [Bacteroidia bacterium]|nr:hypothetical protein [Bacteroidia bacterium]